MNFLVLFFILFSSNAAMVKPFGIAYVNENCKTDIEKSFLSWQFPIATRSFDTTTNVETIKDLSISYNQTKITIIGHTSRRAVLYVEFDGTKELFLDLHEKNKVFVLSPSQNCLDGQGYKVENYSIINPWHQ
ncbi:MAG: hypothetical protein IPM57_09015 [Oligoflexia bacterium]|nr:hypothetical protein [Oligoflexia bacterium]